ncbi:PH domain-containing protein [Ornithinibacillus scapharcae]|uniref:PH domain-containing protein n=1 Tax=Ornithinibacillus scapharcae TaxID=1147159 RepID=UPI001ED93FEF|nr:PH domain-containing protein [Ornithinibacillus scapharcae]
MMSKPEKLHPATIVFNLIKGIKDSIFLIILVFVTMFDDHLLYAIFIVFFLLLLITGTSILSWSRFTYRIDGDELRLEYGIFIRKKRYISKNRIQSIDLTQNLLHRIFKLVKVEIETAGTGSEAEASLLALSLEDGEALRAELKTLKKNEEVEEETSTVPAETISRKRLIFAGATSGSIGVILALVGFVSSEVIRFIPNSFYDEAYKWLIGLGLLLMILMGIGVLLLVWLLGILGTMTKYWNFTVSKVGEDIVITHGLIEKKQITIPIRRIQAVGHVESVFRQPFGYCTVIAEIAGGSNEKGEQFSTVLFPVLKVDELNSFLQKFLPEYQADNRKMHSLPKRALKYYIARVFFPALLLLIAVGIVVPHFIWVPILLLIGSIILGVLQYKDTGHVMDGRKLSIRYRTLSKTTMVMNHKRIQALNKKQHFLHKRENLATIKLSIVGKMGLGKHYFVKELDEEELHHVADWYSYRGV